MKSIRTLLVFPLLAALSVLTISTGVQAASPRNALKAILPPALEVVMEIEQGLGRRLTDDEITALLRSPAFERRLSERIKSDPAFFPCRLEKCVSACSDGNLNQDGLPA